MEPGPREQEALRQRLYRPDASSADVHSYLGAAAPEQDPQAPHDGAEPAPGTPVAVAPVRRRRVRPVLAAAGLAVVLAAAAFAAGRLAPAPSSPPSSAAASFTTSAPRAPDDSLVGTAVVDGGSRDRARGRAASADQGELYTVARGDTVPGIARRFDLCTADVIVALPYGADPADPPAGQRLLLVRGAVAQPASASPGAC
ncbi:hypothetical protein GCM10025783_23030 [Amnibacterium soli]|uniref:LysM domain-containing protein n=1 Tax=Amnibacterium soli TaxID=1282736 RepID=A0ABP8Z935_9MICO